MKYIYYLIVIAFLVSCSKRDNRLNELDELNRPNCGEITRLWSGNTSFEEGNPCGNNSGSDRRFTIQVTNQISKNIKNFCVNISEFIRYDIGDTYCDEYDPDGW